MKRMVLSVCFITGIPFAFPPALADDAAEIAAINASSKALDDAFERQDAEKIRSLMTPDHVAITSYYGAPMHFEEVMKTLPDLKMLAEIIEEEAKIDLALRRNDVPGAAKALIAAKLVSGEKLLQSAYRFGSYLLQKGEYALAHEVTAKALADPLINRKDEEIRERKWRQLKEALFNLNAEAKKKLPK